MASLNSGRAVNDVCSRRDGNRFAGQLASTATNLLLGKVSSAVTSFVSPVELPEYWAHSNIGAPYLSGWPPPSIQSLDLGLEGKMPEKLS